MIPNILQDRVYSKGSKGRWSKSKSPANIQEVTGHSNPTHSRKDFRSQVVEHVKKLSTYRCNWPIKSHPSEQREKRSRFKIYRRARFFPRALMEGCRACQKPWSIYRWLLATQTLRMGGKRTSHMVITLSKDQAFSNGPDRGVVEHAKKA